MLSFYARAKHRRYSSSGCLPAGYNSETILNSPNQGCGAVGYCHSAPGIDRVPESYPKDILRDPISIYLFSFENTKIVICEQYRDSHELKVFHFNRGFVIKNDIVARKFDKKYLLKKTLLTFESQNMGRFKPGQPFAGVFCCINLRCKGK